METIIKFFMGYDPDWEYDSEELVKEFEEAGDIAFLPEKIKGKGFLRFYYGYVDRHSYLGKFKKKKWSSVPSRRTFT